MSDIKVGAYLTSNYGRGPLRAQIISINGDMVSIKHWRGRREYRKGARIFYADLPATFFFSKSCGWRLDRAPTRS